MLPNILQISVLLSQRQFRKKETGFQYSRLQLLKLEASSSRIIVQFNLSLKKQGQSVHRSEAMTNELTIRRRYLR